MIYSIGYHGRTLNGLIRALEEHNITLLVDVRTSPYSRYNIDFNKNRLQQALGKRYLWKGNCLGGLTGVKQLGYDKCLRWLIEVGAEDNVCIMCMEAKPKECHRNTWIAADLKRRFNVDVSHIPPAGKKAPQKRRDGQQDLSFLIGSG